jgi:hypothetical protein
MNKIIIILVFMASSIAFSQVGIGTQNPNSESILDIVSTDKGILIPRVNLTSATQDLDGDTTQPVGLMVFNTGTIIPLGFYFWNGTEWRNVKDSSAVIPAVSTINCLGVSLSPKAYVSGAPYIGTMSIPYTNGNGATYSNGTPIASIGVTGLNATLRAGNLNVGDGVLIYDITGTPSASSPSTATFAIPTTFGATGCNAVVGAGNVFAIGETQSFKVTLNANALFTNSGSIQKAITAQGLNSGAVITFGEQPSYRLASATEKSLYPVINGLRMDFIKAPFTTSSISPVLHNTTNSNIVYSISSLSTFDSYIKGANTILPPNVYSYRIDGDGVMSVTQGANSTYSDASNGTTVNGNNNGVSEYVNSMLTFPSGEWYQITYHATRDATNITFYFTAQRLN